MTMTKGVPLRPTLVPSLPAASFEELQRLAEALDGVASGFQIDIVDGRFVPHRSWPFTMADVAGEWEKIKTLPRGLAYELDCMVEAPEQYLDQFSKLTLKKIIIHVGSTDRYSAIIRHAKAHQYEIVLAFTNDVPLSFVRPFIPQLNGVQIMGIKHVGRQGQPFDERTLLTAQALRNEYPGLSIAVDGSVNEETIPQLMRAGVNHFAPGSAISQAPDPVVAYKHLKSLLT